MIILIIITSIYNWLITITIHWGKNHKHTHTHIPLIIHAVEHKHTHLHTCIQMSINSQFDSLFYRIQRTAEFDHLNSFRFSFKIKSTKEIVNVDHLDVFEGSRYRKWERNWTKREKFYGIQRKTMQIKYLYD